jgi:endoglucanase
MSLSNYQKKKLPIFQFYSTIKILLTALVVFQTICLVNCTNNPETEEGIIIDPAWEIYAQNRKLGNGICLGNILDAPNEGDWGVMLDEKYFKMIADLGFNSVRITIRWSTHTDSAAPYTIDPTFLARVDWAIAQAQANNLNTVIDVHHFERLMSDPETYTPMYLAIWEQLSQQYQLYDQSLFFEILNEPNENLTFTKWNSLLAQAITLIRKSNPARSIIVGTADWGGLYSLNDLALPEDPYLIVTIHYYNPFEFTHQGAEWVEGSQVWKGTKWYGTVSDTTALLSDLQKIENWQVANDRPIYIGEFGSIDYADDISRVMWTSYVVSNIQKREWSFAFWKLNDNFGIYKDSANTYREDLIGALFKPDSMYLVAQQWLEDTGQILDTQFVLVDDFEDVFLDMPFETHLYSAKKYADSTIPDSCEGGWYSFGNDSSTVYNVDGDTIGLIINPDSSILSNISSAIGAFGYEGNGIQVLMYLKGNNYPYVAVGMSLGAWFDDSSYFDLSKLQAVTFLAKGEGEMSLKTITDTVLNGYPEGENWGHFCCDFTLTKEWKQHIIWVKDFKPAAYSPAEADGLTWNDGKKKVFSIDFQSAQSYGKDADDTLTVFIDNIQFHGMNYEDFGFTYKPYEGQ